MLDPARKQVNMGAMLESCGKLESELFKTVTITGSIILKKEISTPFIKSSILEFHWQMVL